MTEPFRKFEVPDVSTTPGPSFELGDVSLRCLPEKPAGVIEDLPMMSQLDDLLQFIRGCIVEEDVDAFNAAIHDKARIVSTPIVVQVYEWIVEAYSGFTPGLPLQSETGQPETGTSSTAVSASLVGVPGPSTPPRSAT